MDEVKSLADANKPETESKTPETVRTSAAKCSRCDKQATTDCRFCGDHLCEEHLRPKLVGDRTFVFNYIKKNEPAKFEEYEKDFKSSDGHPCAKYSQVWNEDMDSKLKAQEAPAHAEPAAAHTKSSEPAAVPKQAETRQETQHRKSKHTLQKAFRKMKILHPYKLKEKLGHYWIEYSRVLHLARKPTRSEFRELSIMVVVGTAIIGGIGFFIQLAIQFI